MSTDLGMVILDIICTFWESIMFVYLTHTFIKKKVSLKLDAVMIGVFVISAEVMTFAGANVLFKVILLMLVYGVGGTVIYKNKIHILEIFISFGVMVFALSAVEVCINTIFELIHFEFHYEGMAYIFHQWQWYLVTHLLFSIVVFVLKKFLDKIHEDISFREEIVLFLIFLGMFVLLTSITAYPTKNQSLYNMGIVAGLIILVVAFLILMFYFNESIKTRLKQEREEHELRELQTQYQYYNERLQEEQRVRQIYHDMKNHLLILQSQLSRLSGTQADEKERKETEEMVASLQHQISDYEGYYETGNAFLDVILRDKMKKAHEKQIDFHVEIDFSRGDFIDGLDISTIFGNALDNAIEACEKVPEDERFITVKSGVKNHFLLIQIENSALEDNKMDRTTKEDAFLHGFGKTNIQRAVEKYQGHCQWSLEQGIHMLSILIPLPQ